ncbi:MAG: GNAT family N-acetyltransferase [Saprospiraceae bacterium]
METIVRTNSSNLDFQHLVADLDQYLVKVNGDSHDFFHQYNNIDILHHTVVYYFENDPAGCGAIKKFDENTMEIKRMYVPPKMRGRGIAMEILKSLEKWAFELGYQRCILETSKTMVDAIGLYQKAGYNIIPNYAQYAHVESSVCFEKML